MPNFNFGDKLSMDRGNLFLDLKSKNDEVHVRFVGGGNYDGKHFMQENGTWHISYCPRIMGEKECQFCEKYFDLLKQSKEEKDAEKKKELEKQMRTYKPKITFYYPVIDRTTEEAKILKTTLSIRLKLEQEVEAEINVTDYDYKIKRTEKPGADYYSFTRLPDKMIKPLTDKEKEALKKAQGFNLEEIVHGKESDFDIEGSEQ